MWTGAGAWHEAAATPMREIDWLIERDLTDDRVFGVISHHNLDEFYDGGSLADLAEPAPETDALPQ